MDKPSHQDQVITKRMKALMKMVNDRSLSNWCRDNALFALGVEIKAKEKAKKKRKRK